LRMLAQKAREERAGLSTSAAAPPSEAGEQQESDEESDEERVKHRDEIRQDRRREREREFRMSRMGAEQKAKYLARAEGRDISEKVALGLAKPTLSKDSLLDPRFFPPSGGLSSGFKDDEAYDLYDKPLFAGSSANMIYNPKKSYDPDLFGGEEGIKQLLAKSGQSTETGQIRTGPIEFEREEADPFDINRFLDAAKKGVKRGLETLSESSKSKRSKD